MSVRCPPRAPFARRFGVHDVRERLDAPPDSFFAADHVQARVCHIYEGELFTACKDKVFGVEEMGTDADALRTILLQSVDLHLERSV